MIQEVVDFAQRDVRGRLVRRWLLSPLLFPLLGLKVFRRIALLEAEYARLYRNSDLTALGPTSDSPERPTFFLLATSMTSGDACAFSAIGLETRDKIHRRQVLPLALAVASSSAFPPLFPPVVLTRGSLDATPEDFPQNFECLSDGGIYDNLGIRWLLRRKPREFDRAILCDASAPLGWNVDSRFGSLLTRTIRATDILMRRVSDLEAKPNPEHDDLKLVRTDLVSIRLPGSGPRAHHEEIQSRIPLMRTDLNAFVDGEVQLLLQHGHAVADQVLGKAEGALSAQRLFLTWFEQDKVKQLHAVLRMSRANPIGLWNSKDWASYVLWGLALSPIVIIWIVAMTTSATIREQAARNSALNSELAGARTESDSLRGQVERQRAVIRDLEERAANPDLSASSPQVGRGTVGRISIRIGEHAHFVGSMPDALTVRLAGRSPGCNVSRVCAINVPGDLKWGTLFVAQQPGAYSLIIGNSSRRPLLVRVAPHREGQELGPDHEVITLRPGQSVEYAVVTR
ncbi:Patatin-like phospholipase [Rhizobacter sp. OV335]|nr:Patatin-like phospholipase [Rhizobacter sp. OV335]